MAKKVLVLGPGCANCERLAERALQAIDELGETCELAKVTDIQQFPKYGLMMTPGLVVDGRLALQGRVPSVEEIKTLLA